MKIKNLQALRGIAVLSVVLFHMIITEKKYGGSLTILPDFLQFGMIGVDIFFILSGFVMVVVTRHKFKNIKTAFQFIYNRASRIYPLYWVYSLLVLVVFIIHPSLVNNSQDNQVNILSSFLLFPSENYPLILVGWTLIHEMYFYVVFFFILILAHEKNLPIILFLWIIVILLMNIYTNSSNPAINLIAHPLTTEFIAGCYLALLTHTQQHRKPRISIILIIFAIALFIFTYGNYHYSNMTGETEPLGWWRIFLFGLPALIIVYCLVIFEYRSYILHSFLIKMGNASYSIYLSHILTLSVIGKLWNFFSVENLYDNLIMIPLLLLCVIIVGLTSYQFIEKPLLAITKKIMY